MKIIKAGVPTLHLQENPWWIGKYAACTTCGQIMQVEESDEMETIPVMQDGVVAAVAFRCPNCKRPVILRRADKIPEKEASFADVQPMPDYPAGTVYWPDKKPEQNCLESDETTATAPTVFTDIEVKCYEGPITCPKCNIPFYEEDRSSHPSNFVDCPRCKACLRKRYSHVIISERELAYLLAVQLRWQDIVNNLPNDKGFAWHEFNKNPELLEQKIQFQRLRIRVKPRFVEAPIPPQETP